MDFLAANTGLGERIEHLVNPIRMYHHVIEEIARSDRRPRRILDVGCSLGYGPFILSRGTGRITVVGVDIEQRKIEEARRLFDASRLIFHCLDIMDSTAVRKLVEETGQFDVVVCFEVLEHIPPEHSSRMMRNLRSALREDGLLFISTPNKAIYDIGAFTKDHVNELHYDELLRLLRDAGFSVEKARGLQRRSRISSSLLLELGLVERSGDRKVTLGKTERLLRKAIVLLFDWRTSFGFLLSRLSMAGYLEWKYRTAMNSAPEESVAVLLVASRKARR